MTPDEMIAVIQAHKNNKQLQYRSRGEWEDVVGTPLFNFGLDKYRIKPEPPKPKLRPWKPEEVPVGAMAKNNIGEARYLIVAAGVSGVCFGAGGTWFDFESCLAEKEYSTDNGKTWHPCGVEE